jgi:hypothetical protein
MMAAIFIPVFDCDSVSKTKGYARILTPFKDTPDQTHAVGKASGKVITEYENVLAVKLEIDVYPHCKINPPRHEGSLMYPLAPILIENPKAVMITAIAFRIQLVLAGFALLSAKEESLVAVLVDSLPC